MRNPPNKQEIIHGVSNRASRLNYVASVHLVTKDNIQYDGGPNNVYDPHNNYQAQYKMIWGK
jgi:hypothetical protein